MRFYPFVFTVEVPCKEVRTPLNSITFNEERDEEASYGYCNEYQPHAVKRMFDHKNGMLYDMRWDEAGNLGQVSMGKPGEMFERGRFLFWTEDNRMHAAVDEKYFSYYAYDHSGERRLKLTGDNKLLDVNADFMATYTLLNEPTLYPSAYMVLTNKGYTKHYYAGTERVAARLGGGGLDALYHVIGTDNTIQAKTNLLFDQSLEQVNHRVLNENNPDCIMGSEFAKEEFGHWIDGIPYQMQAGVELNHDQFKDMVNSMLTDYHNGKEEEVYFYHSDHLGSASWITDSIGIPIQHLQYLPYGEPYVDQRHAGATYSERFTFTGKERDEETGYGYFGARYMDHELMTMWLSVDPMSDKYPGISPYAYCAWNPVKLVDPDGRDIWEVGNKGNIISYTKSDDFDQIHIINDDGSIRASSCQYVLGTISEFHIDNSDETAFSVCGKDDAEDLFVFFAENFTKDIGHPLEWSHAVTDDGANFVGTSHREASCSLQYKLIENGYSIIENTHNHPEENPMPSIFALDPYNHGDLEMAKRHPNITNYVYTSKYGYTKYNSMGVQDEHLLELFSGAVTNKLSNCYDNLKWRSK